MQDISRKHIVEIATQYLGYPSRHYDPDTENHGCDEDGFTCSGFVRFVLTKAGVEIPPHIRHAREFFDFFGVTIHESQKKPGDLVFFSRHGIYPNHVGIVVSDKQCIFSTGMRKGSVVKKNIHRNYKTKIDPTDPKVIYTKNPIGYKRIAFPAGTHQNILP